MGGSSRREPHQCIRRENGGARCARPTLRLSEHEDRTSYHEAHLHRPDHPPGRARQDRHLSRRRRRGGQCLPANPRAARFREVLRRAPGGGHAEPDGADLRRLPGGPPPGGHQGLGRLVPRGTAAGGQEAPRAVLQHFLRHGPHDALLRLGRAGLRRRPRRPAPRGTTSWA